MESTLCCDFAQTSCPKGFKCVDKPFDGCDPPLCLGREYIYVLLKWSNNFVDLACPKYFGQCVQLCPTKGSYFSDSPPKLRKRGKTPRNSRRRTKCPPHLPGQVRSTLKEAKIPNWIQHLPVLRHASCEPCGFPTPDHILEKVDKIRRIPTFFAHGRYDVVCPFESTFDLSQKFP